MTDSLDANLRGLGVWYIGSRSVCWTWAYRARHIESTTHTHKHI